MRVDGRFFSEGARRIARHGSVDHAEPGLAVRGRDVTLQTRFAGAGDSRDDRKLAIGAEMRVGRPLLPVKPSVRRTQRDGPFL